MVGEPDQHLVVRRVDEIDGVVDHQRLERVDPAVLTDRRQGAVVAIGARPVDILGGAGADELDLLEVPERALDLEPYLGPAGEDEDAIRWRTYGMLGQQGKQLYRRARGRLVRKDAAAAPLGERFGPAPPDPAPLSPDPVEHEVLRRLTDIERRLVDVQALAARAYEATLDWPAELAQIRAADDYAKAFEGEPLVSVRIATYHAPDLLCERAIPSLLAQTYTNWEALVVGDHCTDDTEERVRAVGDPRIQFWNLPFRGPYPDDPRARWLVAGAHPANAGIRASRGAWIAPLDHDDAWEDDHIEVLLREAQRTRAELVYGRMRVVNEETGEQTELGTWPPTMGQFAFQGAIHHRGLGKFEYDVNCQFSAEPGDSNLARRMWAAGVRFAFLDRIVGTYHHQPRHRERSTVERLYEEAREWAASREAGLQYSRQRAEASEDRLRALQGGDDAPR